MRFTVTKKDRFNYIIKSYKRPTRYDNFDDIRVTFTLWGAKREINKLKKMYAYRVKHSLPKVVYEEE